MSRNCNHFTIALYNCMIWSKCNEDTCVWKVKEMQPRWRRQGGSREEWVSCPIQTGNWQFQIGEEGEVSGAQAGCQVWNAELWLKQWGDKKVLPVDRGNSIWQPFNKYCPSTFLPSLETFMKIYSQKGDGALPHLCRPHFLKGGKGKDDAREGLMCWWHGLGKGRGAVTQTPD